jgi:hypothetical protein
MGQRDENQVESITLDDVVAMAGHGKPTFSTTEKLAAVEGMVSTYTKSIEEIAGSPPVIVERIQRRLDILIAIAEDYREIEALAVKIREALRR